MIFRKLQGIPSPHRYEQTVPFSMSHANYVAVQGTRNISRHTTPVPDALEAGDLMFRINDDRTFDIAPRNDVTLSKPLNRGDGWKLFTFEGFHEGIYVIDIDHWNEKVFGYDSADNKFFHVKMHLLEHDARFARGKRSYHLSNFMK